VNRSLWFLIDLCSVKIGKKKKKRSDNLGSNCWSLTDHLRPVSVGKWNTKLWIYQLSSLRKQPTFCEIATWTLTKWRLSNESRNSILMRCTTQILVVLWIGWKKKFPHSTNNQKHYQDLGSAHHLYGISALLLRRHFVRAQVATSRNASCFLGLSTELKR